MNGDESRPPADADAGGQPSRSPTTADRSDDRPTAEPDQRPGDDSPASTPRSTSGTTASGPRSESDPSASNSRSGEDAASARRNAPAGDSLLSRTLHARSGGLLFLREVLTSVLAVAAVGMILFAVSGVWPPMVAVESGSMEPHMYKGDLVFITEPGRLMPDDTYAETGVVTAERGEEIGYRTFGDYGSVIVYDNPRLAGSPIIHRTHFWVDAGENWYDRANPAYVRADNCGELRHCPAPHAGFITKGDNNARYDQASDISGPVKAEWVTGVARVRVPLLGWIRLSIATASAPVGYATVGGPDGGLPPIALDVLAVEGDTPGASDQPNLRTVAEGPTRSPNASFAVRRSPS